MLPGFIFDWHTDREKQAWHRPHPELKRGVLEIPNIFEAPDHLDKNAYSWRKMWVYQPQPRM